MLSTFLSRWELSILLSNLQLQLSLLLLPLLFLSEFEESTELLVRSILGSLMNIFLYKWIIVKITFMGSFSTFMSLLALGVLLRVLGFRVLPCSFFGLSCR